MSALLVRLDQLGRIRFALVFAAVALGALYLAVGLYSAWRIEPPGLINSGLPLGRDFVAFWSGARLALEGAPEAVFNLERIHAHQVAAVGAPVGVTAWHYPPTFLLAVMPLGWLPYPLALILWLVLPVVAFWFVLKRLYSDSAVAASLLLFPGVALCLVSGQNGVITAALLGAALLHLDARPLLAGILFGLLTYKPHLAALVFPALAVGCHWRALAAAAATALAMVLASVAVLGLSAWTAFLGNLDFLTRVLDSGAVPWVRMPTVYAAARLLEFDIAAARLLQTLASVAMVAAVCAVWYRRAPLAWRGAALCVALPLATPYCFDYDLVALTLPIAWLFQSTMREKALPVDLTLLTIAWFSPALFWVVAMAGGPPLMPLVLIALMALVCRHAFEPGPADASSRAIAHPVHGWRA
jgi:Glycosyltransferase family 87